jgi:DNA-binding NtrC family response regulator
MPHEEQELIGEDDGRITVLLAMPPQTPGFRAILAALESLRLDLVVVSDCRGVHRQLHVTRPSVVMTGVTLGDGNWCDVLNFIVQSDVGAGVVVYVHEADERLRSEVVSRGAYDLVSGPAAPAQLLRCLEEAHQFRHTPARAPVTSSAAHAWGRRGRQDISGRQARQTCRHGTSQPLGLCHEVDADFGPGDALL